MEKLTGVLIFMSMTVHIRLSNNQLSVRKNNCYSFAATLWKLMRNDKQGEASKISYFYFTYVVFHPHLLILSWNPQQVMNQLSIKWKCLLLCLEMPCYRFKLCWKWNLQLCQHFGCTIVLTQMKSSRKLVIPLFACQLPSVLLATKIFYLLCVQIAPSKYLVC